MDQLSKEDRFRNHVGDDILYVTFSFSFLSDAQHVKTSRSIPSNGIETHIERIEQSTRVWCCGEGERAISAYFIHGSGDV